MAATEGPLFSSSFGSLRPLPSQRPCGLHARRKTKECFLLNLVSALPLTRTKVSLLGLNIKRENKKEFVKRKSLLPKIYITCKKIQFFSLSLELKRSKLATFLRKKQQHKVACFTFVRLLHLTRLLK